VFPRRAMLVTTTPRFDGRSFGTNVMEAVLVALNNGKTLKIAAQQNALSVPDQTRTYVVDTGIAR